MDGPALSVLHHDLLIHCHEAGVGCHQAKLQPDGRDLIDDPLILASVHPGHQVANPAPGPEARQGLAARLAAGEVGVNLSRPALAGNLAAHLHRSRAGLVIAPVDQDGLGAEEVRDALRVDIGRRELAPVDLDVGEVRRADALVEAVHDCLGVFVEVHVVHDAPPDLSHAVEQVAVDAGADAEGEEARLAEALIDGGENLGLIADLAVGHEADDPHALGVRGEVEGRLDALDHLRSAAALHGVDVGEALLDVLGRVRDGLGRELGGAAREADDLEGVVGVHAPDAAAHGLLGLCSGLASHRPGAVDDEDHLLGGDLGGLGFGLRGDHHQEVPADLAVVGEQADLGLIAGDLPLEFEVLVRDGVVRLQRDGGLGRADAGDLHVMALGVEPPERDACVEVNGDADIVARADVGLQDGRRDAGGIGHTVGVRGPAAGTGGCGHWGAGDEPRPDDHWEDVLVFAVDVGKRLDVLDDDLDLIVGQDVADALCEDVRSLLLEEARALPRGDGLLVDLPGFLAGLDDAPHGAVTDLHEHIVDRGVVGQREDIDRLYGLIEGVLVLLGDGDVGHHPGNVGLHVRVLQGELEELLTGLGHHSKGRLDRSVILCRNQPRPTRNDNHQQQNASSPRHPRHPPFVRPNRPVWLGGY